MDESPPRYEFRSFAQQFGRIEFELRERAGAPEIRESAEVYLVSRASDVNVKLRGGLLDIKERIAVERGLEQWRPALKLPLPLSSDDLGKQLFPALGAQIEGQFPEEVDEQALCSALRESSRDVVVVDLFKRRFGFKLDSVQAEVVEVRVNGAAVRSVCVEGVDADDVLHLSEALGLLAYGNISYVAALKRITGLASAPSFRA
ncbi:MAG: hypothetical protein EA417_21695 [Gammaproteobacteria bacterium]|nr:MAG: hypothetical protein EA417_21695 [Gammaproteobacteria bacterium]